MNARRRLALLAALGCFAIALAAANGCGRRGAPRPPEDVLPETIRRLAASNGKESIVLTWERPDRYVDAATMTDLGSFAIERAVGTDVSAGFEEIARIAIEDRDRFRQVKNFRFEDTQVNPGTTYRYRVFSTTTDAYRSAASNEVSLERAPAD